MSTPKLATYTQNTGERKRYIINYDNWLDDTEEVSDIEFEIQNNTTTPLLIDGYLVSDDNRAISYFVSGGEDETTYEVVVTMTTDSGQIKQDELAFLVVEL